MHDPEKDRRERKLWDAYRDDRSKENRGALIEFYLPYVRYICGKMALELPTHLREGDIVSSGVEGLIDAVDKFDPAQDVQFRTYAFNRVRGAVYDELRRLDWAPRSLRRRAREIESVEIQLQQKHGRKVTVDEIAEEMAVPQEEIDHVFANVKATSIMSLDEVIFGVGGQDGESSLMDTVADSRSPDPKKILESRELKESLVKAIMGLPEKEKKVMVLYYYEDLTLKEVGAVMDLTESRVSQIHSDAVQRISRFLKKEMGGSLA